MDARERQAQESRKEEIVTPEEGLARLREGNARFLAGEGIERDLRQEARETGEGQFPFACVLGCIDSRVPPELIFDQGIGDLFCVRVAGNIVNEDVLGSMEFACQIAGARLIVVLGHSDCGAVSGAVEGVRLGHLTGTLQALAPAVEAVVTQEGARSAQDAAFVQRVTEENVALALIDIGERSAVLREMLETGEISLVGAMYDVRTGEVTFWD